MKRPDRASRPVPGKRDQRRVIRVLTEGKVSEPGYLAQWARRSQNIHIDFSESGMAPLTLVERARSHQRSNRKRGGKSDKFDEIWCIFDVDEHPNLSQAINEAREGGIEVALSNPCFELWLILHYQDQTAHIDRRHAQRLAGDLGAIDGKRIRPEAIEDILIKYVDAKRRAIELGNRHRGNGAVPDSNPSSNLWELVDKLR